MERIKWFFLILLISLINTLPVDAQETKYKDIYPYISSGRLTEAEPLLIQYLKDDPENASANLQLALIYEKRFKSYDPISQFDAVIQNAENAKTYFLKAGLLIDEKEIRRYGDKYYTNLAKPDEKGRPEVTYQHVKSVIDSAFIDIDHYLRTVPDVHSNFMNAVKYYRNSYDAFLMLNGNYTNLSELYFQYNNALDKKLLQIRRDCDSSQYFLKRFLEASEIFPLHKYKQSCQVNKIENFRIDGLEPSPDFMDSVISLWDYGNWADDVRKKYNAEFKPVLDGLLTAEESLKSNLDVLSDPQKALQSAAGLIKPDWDLIHKITNYDEASLAAGILLYQDSKQNILFQKLFDQKLSRDTSIMISKNTLLVYYSKLFNLCQSGDSALEQLKKRNNDENRKKYSILLSKYFPDDPDLNKYISGESEYLKMNLTTYAGKIKDEILLKNDLPADSTSFVMYKKIRLPLVYSVVDSANIKPEVLYTSSVVRAIKNEMYVAGFMLPKKNKGSTTAFLAKLDSAKNVQWLNYYTSGGEATTVVRNRIGALTLYPQGIAFILNSCCIKADTTVNTLMLIKDTGKPDTSLVLSQHGFPRMMAYDENVNSFFMTFKGKKLIPDDTAEITPLTWINASVFDGESTSHQFNFSGNLKNIIPLKSGWLVAGNFSRINDPSFSNSTAGDGPRDTKAFTLILDENGAIKKMKVFNNPEPYDLYTVYKINDDNINLLGIPGRMPEKPRVILQHDIPWIHYIFDSNLKVLYYNGDK